MMSAFLAACAGNPPAWWNPRSTQPGQTSAKSKVSVQPQRTRVAADELVNMDAEEDIAVADETYEEMALTPLQDEEQENATGETSAQIMEENNAELLTPSVLDE